MESCHQDNKGQREHMIQTNQVHLSPKKESSKRPTEEWAKTLKQTNMINTYPRSKQVGEWLTPENLHGPYLLSSTKESKDNQEKIKFTFNNTTNDGTTNNNTSNNNNDTTKATPNYGDVNNTSDNDYEPDNGSFFINIDNILGDELNDNQSLNDTISINTENTTEIKDKNNICISFFDKNYCQCDK